MQTEKTAGGYFWIALVLFSLIFYFGSSNKDVDETPCFVSKAYAAETQKNSNPVTIRDMTGRTVRLPQKIHRVITPNVDAFRIIIQLGAQKKLVGIPSNMYGSKYSMEDTIEVSAWPESKKIPKVGGGRPGTEIDIEAILALNPDVVVMWARPIGRGKWASPASPNEQANQLEKKTGIPVVCISVYSGEASDANTFREAYSILGKLLNREERAKKLLNYYDDEVAKIAAVVKTIPAEKRVRAYIGGASNFLQSFGEYLPLVQLGAVNVASGVREKGGKISKEQLVAWNPDIIFLHTPSKTFRTNIKDLLNDEAFKTLNAIKNRRCYPIKGPYMGWDIATGLVDLIYMAKLSYPDHFKTLDVEQKGDKILEKFYRVGGLYRKLAENSSFHRFK